LQVRCAIDQILRNSSNAAQFVKLISGAVPLVKHAVVYSHTT